MLRPVPPLPPALRKLALTAHVTASVGWLGAVAVFLVLTVAGLRGADPGTARAVYPALGLTGRYVVVPLCLASLVTGAVMSLGTPWGLARHYWVLVKLWISVPATVVLLAHMRPVGRLADAAAGGAVLGPDLHGLRTRLVAQAAAALAVLLAATALSVVKPAGLTRHGQRVRERRSASRPPRNPPPAPGPATLETAPEPAAPGTGPGTEPGLPPPGHRAPLP
ncbi:hypothetical protein ACFYT4_27525 [Streptomyces sp. NPDC004609]|uniref:hypothetical protein n=1 Tax=Streptomyces sp. NPDC004609 TaxID=3364704 RepID=UPI003682E7D4